MIQTVPLVTHSVMLTPSLNVKTSFLFRLFTHGVSGLLVTPDELVFCGKNKQKSNVPFTEVAHLPTTHSWLFFHSLEFKTSKGLFKLRGLSKTQALVAKNKLIHIGI